MSRVGTRTRLGFALALLQVALLIMGCTRAEEGHLVWKEIAEHSGSLTDYYRDLEASGKRPVSLSEYAYVGYEPRLIILSDASDRASLQNQVLPKHQQRIARTDFSSYWVAVVFLGYKSALGYSIEVTDVRLEDRLVTISADFHEAPDEDERQSSSHSSPYSVLRIKKPSGTEKDGFEFVLQALGQSIPQSCAIPGDRLLWTKLWYWQNESSYGGDSPQIVAIVDQVAAASYAGLSPRAVDLISKVDYDSHLVIIVYQGLKSTTSFYLEVLAVKRQGNQVSVCAQFHEPRHGAGQAMTSPYYIAEVEKPKDMQGEYTFTLISNGETVSSHVQAVP